MDLQLLFHDEAHMHNSGRNKNFFLSPLSSVNPQIIKHINSINDVPILIIGVVYELTSQSRCTIIAKQDVKIAANPIQANELPIITVITPP